jgi:hypothetical protein
MTRRKKDIDRQDGPAPIKNPVMKDLGHGKEDGRINPSPHHF